MQHQYATTILAIRSDNGTAFKNCTMDEFFSNEDIRNQYSSVYPSIKLCGREEEPDTYWYGKNYDGGVQISI